MNTNYSYNKAHIKGTRTSGSSFYTMSRIFQILSIVALSIPVKLSAQINTQNNILNSKNSLWAQAGPELYNEKPEIGQNIQAQARVNSGGKTNANFTSFSTTRKNLNAEVREVNGKFASHPEIGVLYSNAPCTDCYEILEKRTATQKYYVKKGTNQQLFALQSSVYPIHYRDASGQWMTASEHLEADKTNENVFLTKGRLINATVNVKEGYCSLTGPDGTLMYNHDLELVYERSDGTEESLGKASWKNFTAGDDGVKVLNAWTGIDIEIVVLNGGIKTNYVVNNAMPSYSNGTLLIRDHIKSSTGLKIQNPAQREETDAIRVTTESGKDAFVFNKAIAYEQTSAENTLSELSYNRVKNDVIDIEVPGSLLNKTGSHYPLVIDPLVTGTLSSGFTYTSGTFPPAFTSTSDYCTNTNTVTIPAAATLTDIQVTYNYYGPPAVSWAQSRLAFQINGTCTYGWLSCSAAAFSSGIPGNTCGLMNSSFWSAGPAWGTTSGCLPAYNCSSYTLPFQLLLTQAQTSTAACAQTVYATASGFTVTVFGSTALLPTMSPSTPTVLCMPSTLSITGSPTGGTWSSSTPAVGTVSTSGIVTGITNGTTVITYTASGCTSTLSVTVGTTPTVTGTPAICFPGTTTLTGTPAGGTWTSSATGVATITAGGFVTGVSVGTSIINYNTGTCSVNVPFDVNSPTAVAPTTQPTGLTFSGVTSSGATINFTPNGSTGYLVIASTSPALSATPTMYTTYATGSSFGGGIVVQGSTSGSSPAYTTTLLNSNTYYYVFVFAFNNNCVGPQYNTTSPLTNTFNTCVGPTSTPTVVSAGVNSINLSWTASAAGGGYINPINYTVYAYSDAACTILVPGYPHAAGTGTTFTATGLGAGTQYWFRVSPADVCATFSGIATGLTTCSAAGSIPYLQTFEVNTTLGDRAPNCMTHNVQNCVFSGVQTSVTYIGTINTNHTAGGSRFYNFFRGGACSAGWANQWLLLPGLAMSAGTTYTLSFWYRTDGVTWSSIQAQYSTVSTVPAVTSTSMGGTPGTIGPGLTSVNGTTYAQYIQNFTVPTSGTYYIGIDAQSGGSAGLLAIDDIEVCAVPTVTVTNSPAPYCDPDTVVLSSTGTASAVVYNWSGPSGYTSTVTTPPALTGLGPGTYTYTLTATNDPISAGFGGYCTATATTTFTINTPPGAITGGTSICTGQTTTLSNATAGGTWSSSNTAVGTISSTGVVTGLGAGTTTITYNIGGCYATTVVSVTAMPTPITGILIVCLGMTTSLSSTPTGGTWSSSNTNATFTSFSSGILTGNTLGTSVVTYSMGGSCYVTAVATVNPIPSAITGSFSICIGSSSTLGSATTGGIFTSSAPAVATVGPTTGIVNGISIGTATISYTKSGCRVTQVVTVVTSPVPIVGPTTVCTGSTITLTNATPGGTWSMACPTIATVNPTTGVVTGIGGGTCTVTYSLSAGCLTTTVITVTATPSTIAGNVPLCVGQTSTLTHSTTGGTWSMACPTIATVGISTGLVTAVGAGTCTVTYTLPSGCTTTAVVTVNGVPGAITGTLALCQGASATLSSSTPSGTWTSGTGTVASIDLSTGTWTALTGGTSTITYTAPTGCITTADVTVNLAPAAITGPSSVCMGQTITLSSTSPAGAWSSSDPTVATVSGTGDVFGVSVGTADITYALGSGCFVTKTITVNPGPSAITGPLAMCVGACNTYSVSTTGGTWSSSTPAIGAMLSPGYLCGSSAGTTTITYLVGATGCYSTLNVTINTLPGTIGGTLSACVGQCNTLTNSAGGGTWSSSNPAVATIDATTGLFCGVASGTSTITYSLGSGCITTTIVTVNALPGAISGSLNLCQGGTTTISSTPGFGTWLSDNPTTASIGVGTGIITTGATSGTATISYTLSTGCRRTAVVTVNPLPTAITGTTSICAGQCTTLNTTPAGGTWSSVSAAVGTINPATGVFCGVGAGTTTVSYTLSTGCARTTVMLVNGLPTSITPASAQVCEGSTITMTGSPSGGTWSASCPTIGTIATGSGTYAGISAGTCNVTYTLASGCSLVSSPITVNPLPGAITGVLSVCVGQTTTVSCTPATGTWSISPASGTATIGSTTGVITGGGSGTATITYTLPTGCRKTAIVTINALPGLITGAANVCEGGTTTLNCTPGSGTWSISGSIATIGVTTGIVNGINAGTTTVTYTAGAGCYSTRIITVNPLPDPITGTLATCVGQTTTLSSLSTGGTWSISPTTTATIGSSTGIVTGVSGGGGAATATVTYTLPTTCRVNQILTVYALPSAIGGSLHVCQGSTGTLTTTTPGGTWASSTPAVGTVDAMTGAITGMSTGTTIVTYTLGTGCSVTAVVTVNAIPDPITGTLQVCIGQTTTSFSGPLLGTWSSSSTGIATISSTTGVATGITAGTTTISYTYATGCSRTATLTVHALPAIITGPAPMWVCENSSITLSSSPAGGVWSSPHASVSVNPVTGDVTGNTAGTATVSYTIGTGCVRTTTVTINPLPNSISGNPDLCIGSSTTVTTTSTGGSWISSNPTVATIDASGTVTSVMLGTTLISYVYPMTGCASTFIVTVQPLPSTITGSAGFCNLSSTMYLSSPGGGTWTSSDTTILTIDPTTGMATGVSVDTATITYTLPTGCKTTKDVFLILAPYPITGPNDMCLGQTRMLSNAISGGVWSSSIPGVASVDAVTGAVTGMAMGPATITYTLSTGCASTHPVTVNPIPVGTTGPIQICEGNTAIYSNATPGGTWSSSDTTIATINTTSGLLTAVSGGVVTVTYTLGSGCNAMFTVTVNGLPGTIGGPNQVCEGSTIVLTTTSTTGLWSSADPGVADAGALTGVITGMSAMTPGVMGMGVTLITYTLPTGCFRTHEVTVNPLPNIIVGNSDVCVGDVALYTCATPGGGWVSSNPAQGTIDGVTGVFGGISAGTVIISYVLPTGCIATKAITVHDNPAPISGSLSVCAGFATNLISSPAGGTWSQTPASMVYGTIHTLTGVVSGITAGIIPVTYTLGSGCRAVNEVTVITLPAVVGGPSQVCVNDSIVMTHPTAGGTWSSSNAARATVDPLTGMIHGISAGTVVITYSVSTGCFNVRTITVNALPTPITGPLQVCEGSTITLASTPTPGGIWVSDTTAAATVGYLSGVVTGIAAGHTNISYILGATGCLTRVQVTVNVTPPTITGNPHICMGSANTFTNAMAGGSWFSSNPAIANIDPATGVATSVSLGVVTISYVLPVTGCMAIKTVSVDPLPNVYNVTGGGNYCAGGTGVTIGLGGSQPGVSYELYRGSSVTGYLPGTGFGLNFGLHTAAGVYTVLATDVTSGCQRNMSGSANVVINPLVTPAVSIGISPYDSVCPGQSVTLTAVPTNGGTAPTYLWKVNGVSVSTAGSYAFVPAHGDVVTVTMTSNANCLATTTATGVRTLTVLPTATPVAGVLTTPNDTICQFNPVTFTAAPSYGGATPVYQWLVNGVVVGTGSTYSYIPVDGDVVNLRMTSDYRCRTANTVTSGDVALSVDSVLIPNVTVWADPGTTVTAGKPVTLHASATDAGPNPKFQWKVNGYAVAGATNDSYTAIFNDYDSISCQVTSSGVCANIGTHDWIFITTTILGAQTTGTTPSDIRLLPNPNKGIFTVRGTLGTGNEDVNIDVTDMLGQVVYRGAVTTKQGHLETQIKLDGSLANGMYILTLRSGTEQKVFHFVMEQ